MELRHLRYFRVVAEELHFGRAAARLHMEPQPLNFQIKQLERELGFPLLVHRENRTQLTAAGAAFLADVEAILAAADRAVEHAGRVSRGESGLLRIGYPSPVVNAFLAPAIGQFHAAYPEVSFDLHTFGPADQEAALNRHELDLAFSMFPVPDENFESLVVTRTRFILAVSSGDELATRERVAWSEIDGRDAISIENRSRDYQQRIDDMLKDHGISLKAAQYTGDVESALALVGVGLGIILIPYMAKRLRNDIAFVELPEDAAESDLAAIWRRDDENPLRARFVDTVAAMALADSDPGVSEQVSRTR